MTRTLTLAAVAVSLALGVAAAPAAFARIGSPDSLLRQVQPDIPAGALPPGPAVAEMTAGASRYRVRFDMPARGPATVGMSVDFRSVPPFEVVVRSDRGATYRTSAEPEPIIKPDGPPLFLGTADELARFSRSATAEGIELRAPFDGRAPDCRELAFARFVVVTLRGDQAAQGLLRCAARGAGLIIVGRLTGRSDPDTRAFARLAAGQAAVPWGLGAVAWLPDLHADVADAATQVDALARRPGLESLLSSSFGAFRWDDDQEKPKGVPGVTLVLVLLALYVAVIGPLGYFIGVRPRRAWLAWSWFPLVALCATIALAAGSTLWRGQPAELVLNRRMMISPAGAGVENTSFYLRGSSAARFSVSVPWQDGDLQSIERGYRFGTPFASPAGSLTLTDDRIAGRLTADGLAVGRFGAAGVAWAGSVERRAPEVVRRGTNLAIVNGAPHAIRRAVVIAAADRCGISEQVPAGGERTITLDDCERLTQSDTEPGRWPATVLIRLNYEKTPEGSYLLIAESDESTADVEARPTVKLRTRDVVIVRGPLAGPEPAP